MLTFIMRYSNALEIRGLRYHLAYVLHLCVVPLNFEFFAQSSTVSQSGSHMMVTGYCGTPISFLIWITRTNTC